MSSETPPSIDGVDRLTQSRAEINRWLNGPAAATSTTRASSVPELALRSVLASVAHRHPWALVAGSAAVGAALVFNRRWARTVRPSLLASLAAPLASELVSRWVHTRPAAGRGPVACEPDPKAPKEDGDARGL